MLDDKDTFTQASMWKESLVREAQNLILLLDPARECLYDRKISWHQVIRHFMIKYSEDLDDGISSMLRRDIGDVP